MNPTVEQVANAVLYEGYMLYPYRPSAVKNQRRWNFGVLAPGQHIETQCLAEGPEDALWRVTVRFLRAIHRQVCRFDEPVSSLDPAALPPHENVDKLQVGERSFHTWQEATEHQVNIPAQPLAALVGRPLCWPFTFPASESIEPIGTIDGAGVQGILKRRAEPNLGVVHMSVEPIARRLFQLTVTVENLTPSEGFHPGDRESSLAFSTLSTHCILRIQNAEFVSLIDPPEEFSPAAVKCRNEGVFPVLAGEPGDRHTILASPVILYDYPQIAPESPGDLFDATEIDEILSLRVMTLTDDEKREMRDADERTRELLQRTEQLPAEHLWKLHGVMRMLHPERGAE